MRFIEIYQDVLGFIKIYRRFIECGLNKTMTANPSKFQAITLSQLEIIPINIIKGRTGEWAKPTLLSRIKPLFFKLLQSVSIYWCRLWGREADRPSAGASHEAASPQYSIKLFICISGTKRFVNPDTISRQVHSQ